jgi:hypothetical protein
MAGGLAADLGTLLSVEASPSPPDVTVGAAGRAHVGVLWARCPTLRPLLALLPGGGGAGSSSGDIALPEGVSDEAFEVARQWIYRGELPRGDDGPLGLQGMRELLALAADWELPALALQKVVALQLGGLLGVARPQIQALCKDFSAAFTDIADTPFFDVVLRCTGNPLPPPDLSAQPPEPAVEPEPQAGTPAGNGPVVLCRGNRAVLCCRSGFFRAMLSPTSGLSWSETQNENGVVNLSLPFSVHNFSIVNSFLHTGEISLESIDELRFAVELADYFDIAALHERCGDYIIEALSVETACELWNAVETTSLGRLAEAIYGAAGRESGANEREDLLGNPGQICCDFVTQYLSAIVQTEAFLSLGHEQLQQVLLSGLAVVPTERLMESVHQWVAARVETEFGPLPLPEPEEEGGGAGVACPPPGGSEEAEEKARSIRGLKRRRKRREELLGTLLPPATIFNRSTREMILGVGGGSGPASLV